MLYCGHIAELLIHMCITSYALVSVAPVLGWICKRGSKTTINKVVLLLKMTQVTRFSHQFTNAFDLSDGLWRKMNESIRNSSDQLFLVMAELVKMF